MSWKCQKTAKMGHEIVGLLMVPFDIFGGDLSLRPYIYIYIHIKYWRLIKNSYNALKPKKRKEKT